MNTYLSKILKGTLAIISIKLLVFTGILIIQSCQKNSLDDKELNASEIFLQSMRKNIAGFEEVPLVKKTDFVNNTTKTALITNPESALISVYSLSDNPYDVPTFDSSLYLRELTTMDNIDLEVSYIDGSRTDNITEEQILLTSYEISINDAKTLLQPTLRDCKTYLYSKGLTEADIANLLAADEEGPAMSESDLIPVVLELISYEQNQGIVNTYDFNNMFGSPLYASQIGQCAGDALGISAIVAVIDGGLATGVAKELLKKAIRKAASRALGWVGAAIFTYEFGDCMGWW